MRYRDIRKLQNKKILFTPLIDLYAYLFSPVFTKFFIQKKIIPNFVTVLMIISGIIGAILFSIPNFYIKILGTFCIHIWYILDASDGEVARITKRFSKFGKELDYTAHVVNHPLFIISFCLSTINLPYKINFIILIVFAIDTMVRNLFAFYEIRELKETTSQMKNIDVKPITIIKYVILTVDNFPLFALCFPILYLFGCMFGYQALYFFVILKMIVSLFMVIRAMLMWLIYIYTA